MPKPVCVKCQCFYRPKRNGFYWTEMMPSGVADPQENIRGLRKPQAWMDYKLWSGDLYECPDCEHQIVVGHGAQPIAEHWHTEYMRQKVAHGATQLEVKDC